MLGWGLRGVVWGRSGERGFPTPALGYGQRGPIPSLSHPHPIPVPIPFHPHPFPSPSHPRPPPSQWGPPCWAGGSGLWLGSGVPTPALGHGQRGLIPIPSPSHPNGVLLLGWGLRVGCLGSEWRKRVPNSCTGLWPMWSHSHPIPSPSPSHSIPSPSHPCPIPVPIPSPSPSIPMGSSLLGWGLRGGCLGSEWRKGVPNSCTGLWPTWSHPIPSHPIPSHFHPPSVPMGSDLCPPGG